MEPWVKAHLAALGVLNADGVSRRVSSGRCPQCRAVVLRGLDSDRCAVPVTVDVAEIDAIGELLATMQGRRTFDLLQYRAKQSYSYCLEPRRAVHIAKPRRYSVYAEHRCGAPLPAAPPATPRRVLPDRPPF